MIVVQITSNEWLEASAADSLMRAFYDGCPSGGIRDAGRTSAEQWYLWNLQGHLGLASYPGSDTSRHEQGTALDLYGATQSWFLLYGGYYGWYRPYPVKEPWHWEYRLVYDKDLFSPKVPALPAAIPATRLEDEMIPFITNCYEMYFNRPGSPEERVSWALSAERAGWNLAELNQQFKNSIAESGTVVRAYNRWLGRTPSAADIAAWANGTRSVQGVFDGVSQSQEAKN